MKKELSIKRICRNRLIFWTAMSALGVIAIPTMIVALVNGVWALAIPCLVIVVFDFYGLPFGWMWVATTIKQKNLALTIVEDGMTDIRQIALAYNKSESSIVRRVTSLIAKRYLPGYTLNPAKTEIIKHEKKEEPKPKAPPKTQKCPNCGANITQAVCPYCDYQL